MKIPWYEFCLGSVLQDFTKDEMSEIALDDTVYDFSLQLKKKMYLIFMGI